MLPTMVFQYDSLRESKEVAEYFSPHSGLSRRWVHSSFGLHRSLPFHLFLADRNGILSEGFMPPDVFQRNEAIIELSVETLPDPSPLWFPT